MDIKSLVCLLAFAGVGSVAVDAAASSVSGNLNVQIVIGNGCSVGNGTTTGNVNTFGTVDFGTQASPIVNYVDAQSTGAAGSTINLTCSTGTPYTVALDGGQHATGTTRQMATGTNNVTYGLYQDAARNTAWGNGTTFGTTLAGTGTGAAQTLTVYGRVPPQATAVPSGTYTDIVLVTVTW